MTVSRYGIAPYCWILLEVLLTFRGWGPGKLVNEWKSLSRIQLFKTPLTIQTHGILQNRTLESVAIPLSKGSSQSSDQTQVSHPAGGFFTSWATREAQDFLWNMGIFLTWKFFCILRIF